MSKSKTKKPSKKAAAVTAPPRAPALSPEELEEQKHQDRQAKGPKKSAAQRNREDREAREAQIRKGSNPQPLPVKERELTPEEQEQAKYERLKAKRDAAFNRQYQPARPGVPNVPKGMNNTLSSEFTNS